MATNLPVEVIKKQDWLEPIADRLQPAIAGALGPDGSIGPKVADLLHGTWLGHPLHVVLTDVPIGSWTAAAVFDFLEEKTGNRAAGRGADAAIALGLVGAAGAAITGLADWSKIGGGQPRRIGLAHGLLNATATACYVMSLCLRSVHSRSTGRRLALLGLMVSSVAAYLGGHLVFKEKIGVDHTADYSRRKISSRCWQRRNCVRTSCGAWKPMACPFCWCAGANAFTLSPKPVPTWADRFQKESWKMLRSGAPGMGRGSRWTTGGCSKVRRCTRSLYWRSGYATVKSKCEDRIVKTVHDVQTFNNVFYPSFCYHGDDSHLGKSPTCFCSLRSV